jgi:predicted molibdopterin-dependent oxidoreductase YjgC
MPRSVVFEIDGRSVSAEEGETLLGALWAAHVRSLHRTARSGESRGFFCGIGVCFDCLVVVDGERSVRACMTPIAEGMQVETQQDAGLGRDASG